MRGRVNKTTFSFGNLEEILYNINVRVKRQTMIMKRYKVSDIEWCVDYEEDRDTLPTEAYVFADDEDEIADVLSDDYGFLVEGFSLD